MVYIKKQILKSLVNLSENYLNKLNNTGISIINIEELQFSNKNILSNLKEPEKSLFEIILNSAYECEKKYSDGFSVYLKLFIEHFKNLNLYLDLFSTEDLDLSFLNKEFTVKEKISFQDIKDILNSKEFSDLNIELKNLLEQSILYSDRASKYFTKKSLNNNYILSFENGFKFSIKDENTFIKSKEVENPFIVLIDGFIESVSEIHKCLESASETKDNIVIFCRGAAQDVIQTIKVNQKRDAFNIDLIIIPFDEYNLNKLKDISIISSDNNIILSSKGDLISGLNYKNFNRVEKVIYQTNSVIFENKNVNKASLISHLNYLIDSFKSCDENGEMAKLLIERIESLNSKQTVIYVPDSNFQKREMFLCNKFYKKVSEIINSNLIQYKDITTSKSSFDFAQQKISSLLYLFNNTKYVLVNS